MNGLRATFSLMRTLSRFQLLVRRALCCAVSIAGVFAMLPAMAASTLVEEGQLLYSTAGSLGLSTPHNACSDCHFTGPPPRVDGQGSNHPQSANFAQLIQNSFLPATMFTFRLVISRASSIDSRHLTARSSVQLQRSDDIREILDA